MQKVKFRVKFKSFCRFDFQIKHMFRKIKSRSFIFCSQSLKNNYFCSFTLLSKILNEQWSIGSQPPRSNDTRFLWTYKENILVGIYMRYCKYIFTLFKNANESISLKQEMSNIKMSLLIFYAGCGISMMEHPAHFSIAARQVLNGKFPNRWIGRGGPVPWPPRSPDLTPWLFLMGAHEESGIRYCRGIWTILNCQNRSSRWWHIRQP